MPDDNCPENIFPDFFLWGGGHVRSCPPGLLRLWFSVREHPVFFAIRDVHLSDGATIITVTN